jgi:hypothetical protein
MPGIWQLQPITIDGNNKDWPSPYPEYDEKAMLGYAVSNDKDNLYITVETGDPATQLKILTEGLTVWIDRKGEKEEVTAINFPIPNTSKQVAEERKRPSRIRVQEEQGSDAQRKQRLELEDRVRTALNGANEYSLQGFKACNLQFPIQENDTCGIKVRIGLDADNELIWEAVIPFKTFYFKPEISRADKGRQLSVCFETVGLQRPPGQGNGGNSGGRRSGGGFRPGIGVGVGGGMGMYMGGGSPRGGSRSNSTHDVDIMEPMYKSTKTYKKFGLAFQ